MTSKNSNPPETDSASILGESVARVSSPDHITQNPAESCGGSSPTHFNESGKRLSKRERIRSRNPFVKQVSKLEPIGSSKRKSRASDHRGRSSENGKKAEEEFVATTDIGILADSDYDEYLLGPVAWLRRRLIASLRWESKVIAWHQRKIRHPLLDRFFVYTSLLGTHSFFLIVLPTTFWLGDEVFARGLVNSLAFGVYLSSAIKDLFCVPRPYSPPVTRLAIGSVHLEYGFLSTHSTNGVGMALYIYLWVLHYRSSYSLADDASCVSTKFWEVGLLVYTLSVVYGRVYAGMHSVVDCLCGSLLGAGITLIQWWLFGAIEAFLTVPGWLVPFSIAPACLLMIYVHPEPLDDCPCFEDAIAFISVVQGVCLGRWASVRWETLFLVKSAITSPHVSMVASPLIPHARQGWAVIAGVLCIFLLRIAVKTMCKLMLPTIFRFVDRTFGLVLPRRHYIPSSEYDEVPLDNLLRPPSIVDIPSSLTPKVIPVHQSWADKTSIRQTGGGLDASATSSAIRSRTRSSESHSSASFDLHTHDSRCRDSSGLLAVPDDQFSRPGSPSTWSGGSLSDTGSSFAPKSREPIMRCLARASSQTLSKQHAAEQSGQVQFPPSPRPSLSVPLTHPTSQAGESLPSKKVADGLAAALSSDEAKRQAVLLSPGSNVTHYDIDVLTKVCVYTSIGFAASSLIPAWLNYMGWTH